jgi:RsiW-degrading membrane proteinase PrsW (M82 family)
MNKKNKKNKILRLQKKKKCFSSWISSSCDLHGNWDTELRFFPLLSHQGIPLSLFPSLRRVEITKVGYALSEIEGQHIP